MAKKIEDIFVKLFLQEYSYLIQDDEWKKFYELAMRKLDTIVPGSSTTEEFRSSSYGHLTECLLEAGIDPLDYLDYVPECYLFGSNVTNIDIPNHITSIQDTAFSDCSKLNSIKLPSKLTYIGINAFRYCDSLNEMSIPDTVQYIGSGAFRASGISNIIFPQSLDVIEDNICSNCHKLQSIILESDIRKIGDFSFSNCNNLVDITYNDMKDKWQKIIKGKYWNDMVPAKIIHCIDGDVEI